MKQYLDAEMKHLVLMILGAAVLVLMILGAAVECKIIRSEVVYVLLTDDVLLYALLSDVSKLLDMQLCMNHGWLWLHL